MPFPAAIASIGVSVAICVYTTSLLAAAAVRPDCAEPLSAGDEPYCGRPPSFCVRDGEGCTTTDAKAKRSKVIITQGDHAFCAKVLNSTFQYVEFDVKHDVPLEVLQQRFIGGDVPRVRPSMWVGKVDVNNDGYSEFVLPVEMPDRCNSMRYIEVDETRTRVANTRLNEVLAELPECRDQLRPIRLSGRTYFETRTTSLVKATATSDGAAKSVKEQLLWELLVIEGNTVKTLCVFKYRR